jgi:hypothetical protein
MALSTLVFWGGQTAETHGIPLYLSGQHSPYFLAKLKNNIFQRYREGISKEEAEKRNTKSLLQAAKRLNQGNVLIIAPTGGSFFSTTHWKDGVGVLIKIVRNLDTQVCFVRESGGSRWHLLRMLNPYLFGSSVKPVEISIDIQPPIPLIELKRAGNSAKEISEAAKQKYIEIFGYI